MRKLLIALILFALFIYLFARFSPTAPAQPDTTAIEQQIQQLEADIASTRAELEELKQSHSLMLGVTEDIDYRLAGVEGKRR